MYLRRHCYDKPHRCPGWAGGGWKFPRYDVKPDSWYDVSDEEWQQSGPRKRHWWHAVNRCESGTLWDARRGEDPWFGFRWHHCTVCDVRAIPHVLRWLDPTWWGWVIRTDLWWPIRDLRDHRDRWEDPSGAPWWSLPAAIWRGVRSWFRYRVVWDTARWFRTLYRWHAPRYRAERAQELADLKTHYGIT